MRRPMRGLAAVIAVGIAIASGGVAPVGLAHADPPAAKKVKTAQILAGVGTGVSSAIVVTSFLAVDRYDKVNTPLLYTGLASSIVTPSLGQWYVGEWVTPGMAVRVGAVGLATYAITHEQHDVVCQGATASDQKCKVFYGAGIAMLGLAGIAYIGGAAYDVLATPDAVDEYNSRHMYMVAPTALVTPSGGLAPGVYFSATY